MMLRITLISFIFFFIASCGSNSHIEYVRSSSSPESKLASIKDILNHHGISDYSESSDKIGYCFNATHTEYWQIYTSLHYSVLVYGNELEKNWYNRLYELRPKIEICNQFNISKMLEFEGKFVFSRKGCFSFFFKQYLLDYIALKKVLSFPALIEVNACKDFKYKMSNLHEFNIALAKYIGVL